eukprot:TRINITY_DN11666_c0_g1_i1.p1 TRINITY_DN11666_c0_g1~~TRINITY_DN11666_c0_g1_i1.p1  ORF type:complete len:225 (-),score=96.62 TRINITY_DN11666_c0_g1_i1:320-994(-)
MDKQTEVLQKVSDDLIFLRTKNTHLQEENIELKKKIKAQIDSSDVGDVAVLDKLGADELKKKIFLLSQKLQNKLIKKNEIERKCIELQKSHAEQSFVNQTLREENAKLRKFKKTAAKQEEVIEKLETLLAETLKQTKREKQNATEETAALKSALAKSQSQIATLKKGFESDHFATVQSKINAEKELEETKKRLREAEKKLERASNGTNGVSFVDDHMISRRQLC